MSVTGWLVVSGASAGGTTEAAAAGTESVGLAAAVAADGVPLTGAEGWQVKYVDTGRYELRFPAAVQVALRSWDSTGQVTVRPRSATTWLVSFLADGEPVDSGFSFVASPALPDVHS